MNIVFDIGGTNMRIATAQGATLGEVRKVPTPKDPTEAINLFVTTARELSGGAIEKIVGDVPGSIDAEGRLYDIGNLPHWQGREIGKDLSHELGAPAHIFNDCILVGFGEAREGAGKGFPVVAYITVSTGVGGAKIDGNALSKSSLLADFVDLKRRLNEEISGNAVKKKFGIEPKALASIPERNKLADILAEGLRDVAEMWKPDVFVLGGSMIVGVNPIPLERVREKFSAVPVKMAALKDNGGLIGAAILLQHL